MVFSNLRLYANSPHTLVQGRDAGMQHEQELQYGVLYIQACFTPKSFHLSGACCIIHLLLNVLFYLIIPNCLFCLSLPSCSCLLRLFSESKTYYCMTW